MVIEAIANTHKRTRRRARLPDPYELLDQLEDGDIRLLQWLLRNPFQRAEDLTLATGNSSATVYRHLKGLHNTGLIERVMPPALGTGTCWLNHLSNLGLQVLAVHEQADAAELARIWRTDERCLLRLLPRLSSLVTLQGCINGLVVHAPEALAHQGRWSEVRWHWIRDYAHRFSYREKLMRCTADAALLLRVRHEADNGFSVLEQWYSLFVLLDDEIAGDTLLKQRIVRLLYYRESAERWPVYQHFPTVIVLVSTRRRMEHWHWCAREAATVLRVAPLMGVIACLPEKQSHVPYNPWRLVWKVLGTNGPCTLRHMFHILPKEAIPPGLWNQHTIDTPSPETTLTNDRNTTASISSNRKRKRIIIGNYMERAKAVQIDDPFTTHDEWENIAMLGLNLGQRHLELLTLLFAHPLLHVREIAALFEREVSSIERYLSVLHSNGCIEQLGTDGGQRWRLCERGLRLLAGTNHVSINSITTLEEKEEGVIIVQRGLDVLLRHIEHTAGIYGFFASLSQAAREERLQGHDHRLLWWETGAICERRYHEHDHWHNLRPDAFAEYQAGERRMRFWLEWDRGTMSSRDLTFKCSTYLHYVTSGVWLKQEATLPFLLVVTPNLEQERRFSRVVTATLTERCSFVIRTTNLTRILEQGLMGPIWNQVFPHNRGHDLMPYCTFYI